MSTTDKISSLISQGTPYRTNPAFRQAAVLIGILQTPSGEKVIFNRRASLMNSHAGEICLPGGVLERRDNESHINAAVREANEEIGLPEENIQVIGALESCVNSRKLEVTPVVARIMRPAEWILQPTEVDAVIELPLGAFLEAGNYKKISRQYRGRKVSSVSITCDHCEIWGLTAKIMMRLQQLVEQRH